MTWLCRVLRRRPTDAPDTATTMKARQATEQLAATEQRIDAALSDLRERERAESIRRINRTGNFAEGWLVPERREDRP